MSDTLQVTALQVRHRCQARCRWARCRCSSLDPAAQIGAVGTPVSGGLSTAQAMAIVKGLQGINLIGADLVEVSPPYDHAEITALAGATLAFQFLGLFARAPSHGKR